MAKLRELARLLRRSTAQAPLGQRLAQSPLLGVAHHPRVKPVLIRLRRAIGGRGHVQLVQDKALSGFYEAGLAELDRIASTRTAMPHVRRRAAQSATLVRASSRSPEDLRRALKAVTPGTGWLATARLSADDLCLRLSLLQALGLEAEASELVANPPRQARGSPDFHLLSAAQAGPPGEPGPAAERRVAAVSAGFRASCGLAVALVDPAGPATIDNLRGASLSEDIVDGPLVSVIVPAFRCADTIATSLRSLQQQTWRNLEILVVDDASPDGTADVVAGLAEQDPRIRLIRLDRNGGAYVARNTALAQARGDFVTVQDSDDWSHPERIKRHVTQLLAAPDLVANVSRWARATPELRFERRLSSLRAIHFNSSSIMFRREPALARTGFWDSLRFGADTEYWHRLQAVFGKAAVEAMPDLLAIGVIREESLSRASASSYRGGKMGARKSYHRASLGWHRAAPDRVPFMPFPLKTRPFGVPEILRTGRSRQGHFDALLVSDFRYKGGTSVSSYQELVAQVRAGIRTAIIQADYFGFDPGRGLHPDIQSLVDSGQIEELVYGDEVTCDVAVVRFPPVFSTRQEFLPLVRTSNVRVVVNQPPRRLLNSAPFYSIGACKENLAAWLGQPGDWVPIGPQVREALRTDGEEHHLSAEDWFNVADVDAWRVERTGWVSDRPVIGRHSRDVAEKWMSRRQDILAAYPEDPSVTVRILGGATVPTAIIGHRPSNWEVLGFSVVPPRDFLASLDFFVFFPHEERIEAFGRTIIEAMASGCLAILPPVFEPLFGPAAIYCGPSEVLPTVRRFYADRTAYLAQTALAELVVRERFGFEQHIARLRRAMAGSATAPKTDTLRTAG